MSGRRTRFAKPWTSAAARRLYDLAGNPPDITGAVATVAGKYLDGVPCPPTDLEALRPALNILRFEAQDLPISGELRRERGGFVVVYSSSLGVVRRRFTIAHEIAHAIFESSGPNCPRTGRELERLCDMLATELLMPRRVFLGASGRPDELGWEKVDELARLFKTSLSATALRCAELLGATVFEVEDGLITWAYGAIRKGPVGKLHEDLRQVIEGARAGGRESPPGTTVFSTTDVGGYAEWRVEVKAVGQPGRMLVLMLPRRREPSPQTALTSPSRPLPCPAPASPAPSRAGMSESPRPG